MNEVETKPRRVLVYRLGSLGDMVVALPALHVVKQAFGEAEVRLLTNRPVHAKAAAAQAVLGGKGVGLVDGYFGYRAGTRNPFALLRLWWRIRRWGPEVAVYLTAARGVDVARRDARFLRLCGVKRLVGVPETGALQSNFYGADTDAACAEGWEPEAARLLRCVAELGTVELDDASSWDLRLTAEERRQAERQVGAAALGLRLIAVSVGTKVQAKDWGIENWRSLLGRMGGAFQGWSLLLVGAAAESAASEFAATAWRSAGGGVVVNLCGRLSPRESAAALARAELFVGHDSGPMHLAAAVGTPCVGVFAARNRPRQWFPMGRQHRLIYHRVACWGCGLETCVAEAKRCLTSITVDEVMEVVAERLSAESAMMGSE